MSPRRKEIIPRPSRPEAEIAATDLLRHFANGRLLSRLLADPFFAGQFCGQRQREIDVTPELDRHMDVLWRWHRPEELIPRASLAGIG